MRPDWLVLRWQQVARITQTHPPLLTEDYSTVKVFDVTERIAAYHWLPGREYLTDDQTFAVFKRNKGGATPQSGH